MKTAVVYARYSSDNQSEQSIEGQLRVCEEYAQRNNIMIIGSYVDRAMTGTNDHRPEFQRMIKDSHNKSWDYVIVYKLDRFSRDKYETVIHRKTLRDNGIKLLSAMENIPDTPEGIILEGLLESMNQYFSAELSQKTKRGMRETRLKGHFQGGHLVYGYKLDGRKIVIDEDEAVIVRYIFKQYDTGVYLREIIEELNKRGITNRGKPFCHNTVYRMLKMERYTGIYHFGEEAYHNMYPKIIEKDQFDRIQERAKTYCHGKGSLVTAYLLSRKVYCGHCGCLLAGEYGTGKTGKHFHYYRCSGHKRLRNGCPNNKFIAKEKLENFVVNALLTALSKPEIMNKLIDHLMQLQSDLENNNETINLLEREQKQARVNLDNLLHAVEQGIINQTTNQRMQELEEQITKLDKLIILERTKKQIKIPREKIEQYYQEALLKKSRRLIDLLVKEIRLYTDKMKIIFNTPLRKSPDDNQGSFYMVQSEVEITNKKSTTTKKFTTYFIA